MLMNKIAIKKIERFKFSQKKFCRSQQQKGIGMAIFFWSLNFFPSKKLLIYHIEEYLVREIKTRTPAISLVSVFMKMSSVCKVLFLVLYFVYSFGGWNILFFHFSLFLLVVVVSALLGYLSISVQGLGCAVTMGLILM